MDAYISPLTQGYCLKYNVEFIFNSTLYMHAHTFVLNPTCLSLHPFCEPKHL